jgi:nucleotide-binding universal stress UspA family protein
MTAPNTTYSRDYASILVSVDLEPDAERRIKLAGMLARQFSAYLIGVAAEEIAPQRHFKYSTSGEATITELAERQAAEDLVRAANLFRHGAWMCKLLQWHSAFRQERGFNSIYLARHARAADLLVVSPAAGPAPARNMRADPSSLVLMAGRPVLIVPPEKDFLSAEHIVIAWKDSREARRAVSDSLPLLKRAKRVLIVTVGPDGGQEGADEVGTYLQHHDIASEVLVRPKPAGTVAQELLDAARTHTADLIVCGAYGHGRARELVFGGVTRDLLQNAPICCLMSH